MIIAIWHNFLRIFAVNYLQEKQTAIHIFHYFRTLLFVTAVDHT
jgi:hypothetical protein